MNVKENIVYIDIFNEHYHSAKEQINSLAQEAAAMNGSCTAQPRSVQIGTCILFDFLYLLEYDVRIYGEFATLYVKYLRADR